MKILYMTKGLPGSGKSTWAKSKVEELGTNVVKRVNKDDLRAMLDNGKYSKGNEAFVLQVRDMLVSAALAEGKHVIVDDTNLDPKHEQRLREIARIYNVVFELVDFTHVHLTTCIKRDSERVASVGKKIITQMYNRYLNTTADINHSSACYAVQDITLPEAIIVDVDGTIAHHGERSHYDYSRVLEDAPIDPVINFIDMLQYMPMSPRVIVVSGRDDCCYADTVAWLDKQCIIFDELHMRVTGDNRSDDIIKEEIYNKHIKGRYNVLAVFDDRNRVVDMWRRNGLLTFQVWYGDF